MADYRSMHRSGGESSRKGEALRIICSWCKKVEKKDDKWVQVGPVAPEEKVGHRCCPACDARTRGERLPHHVAPPPKAVVVPPPPPPAVRSVVKA